jgi:acyl-homoserine-lactone acylase
MALRHRIGRQILLQAIPLLGLLLVLIGQPGLAVSRTADAPHGQILWDSYGIPHIFARNETGVFYGFGWAQAQSHGNKILRLFGQARGRAAEYWGESYLADDRWVVANGIYERAKIWYRQQDPRFRRDLDAFAQGINDFAAKHPQTIASELMVV